MNCNIPLLSTQDADNLTTSQLLKLAYYIRKLDSLDVTANPAISEISERPTLSHPFQSPIHPVK